MINELLKTNTTITHLLLSEELLFKDLFSAHKTQSQSNQITVLEKAVLLLRLSSVNHLGLTPL